MRRYSNAKVLHVERMSTLAISRIRWQAMKIDFALKRDRQRRLIFGWIERR